MVGPSSDQLSKHFLRTIRKGQTRPHPEGLHHHGTSPVPWQCGDRPFILTMSLAGELTTELCFEGGGLR